MIQRYNIARYLYFGQQARKNLYAGIKGTTAPTQLTLGPYGRNVLLDSELGLPKITKDGVTVVKSVSFLDRSLELGSSLIKRTAHSTNTQAGDGTTTSSILATAIIDKGLKYIQNDVSPIELKKGIDKGKQHILEFLEEIAEDCTEKEDFYKIAMVSSNYDQNISEVISEAVYQVGVNGAIEIEPGFQEQSTLQISNGISIQRGYASAEFGGHGQNKVTFENPLVFICQEEIESMGQIVPALDIAKKWKKPLFIICSDMSQDVMNNLVFNLKNDIVKSCVITVPGFGDFTSDTLSDFSVMTGAYHFQDSSKINVRSCTEEHLGSCDRITTTDKETILSGYQGDSQQIQERFDLIKMQIDQQPWKDQQVLKNRLGRLQGKLALCLVGGRSDPELFEHRDRMIDALNSVKMANKHGMLPGGSTALLKASKILSHLTLDRKDQQYGVQILQEALKAPIRQLLKNADLEPGIIIEKLMESDDVNEGYNLKTNSIANMMEDGIVDSAWVVQQSLENAISVGTMILTTEVIVANEKAYTPTGLKYYQKKPF